MLDKVIKLYSSGAAAQKADAKATYALAAQQALTEPAPQQSGKVAVRVVARAPEGRCELKLWNEHGRKPEALKPPLEFRGSKDARKDWDLPKELDGYTLTWSARFFATRADRFELRVEVLLDGDTVKDGVFHYAGPLEASEIEERTGRFHFQVIKPPKGQNGSAV